VIRLVSWNIGGPGAGWRDVDVLDADVALLQEAQPPTELRDRVVPDPDAGEWFTAGPEARRWRTAIERLSDRVRLEPVVSGPLGTDWAWGSPGCSRVGSWCAARFHDDDLPPITVVSVYAAWNAQSTGTNPSGRTSRHTASSPTSPRCCPPAGTGS
jgi:hypothetical protein